MKKEDKYEYLFVAAIGLIIFSFWALTPVNALFHEMGHQFVCLNQGGTYISGDAENGYVTKCEGVTEPVTFFMAGIGAEVLFGLLLLAFPLISPLGALIILKVVLNMMGGHYATDLSQASEMVPVLSALQSPIFQSLLLSFAVVILIASLYYTRKMVKVLDIPLID